MQQHWKYFLKKTLEPLFKPGREKDFRAPIFLGTPSMCTLSHTMPVIMRSSVNTCHGGGKNPSSAISEANVWGGGKGVKKDMVSLNVQDDRFAAILISLEGHKSVQRLFIFIVCCPRAIK